MAALTAAQLHYMRSHAGAWVNESTHSSVTDVKGHLVTAVGTDGRDNLDIAGSNRSVV